MDKLEAAQKLNMSQYREEGSKELFEEMKQNRLVAVFGASDDLMEFNGAIYDEIGAYDGTTAVVNKDGLLTNLCENDNCPYHKDELENGTKINAEWCNDDEFSWTYKTDIPHATFIVMEDEDPYCRGIVFSLDDVK